MTDTDMGGKWPASEKVPDEIVAGRARLIIAGRGSIKCDLDEARAWMALHPLVMRVEVSTVRLLADGSEVLSPWRADAP